MDRSSTTRTCRYCFLCVCLSCVVRWIIIEFGQFSGKRMKEYECLEQTHTSSAGHWERREIWTQQKKALKLFFELLRMFSALKKHMRHNNRLKLCTSFGENSIFRMKIKKISCITQLCSYACKLYSLNFFSIDPPPLCYSTEKLSLSSFNFRRMFAKFAQFIFCLFVHTEEVFL